MATAASAPSSPNLQRQQRRISADAVSLNSSQTSTTSSTSSSASLHEFPSRERTKSTDYQSRHDHPYPIRTTSSSLLTRSNSIGSTHKPISVTSRTPASPALGRSQGRGHKHSRSQNSITKIPSLPVPDSLQATEPPKESQTPVKNETTPTRGVVRSKTLPSFQHKKPKAPPSNPLDNLPPNPKTWTSSHLATYLSCSLRVKGGGIPPHPIMKDITSFIISRHLSGRIFLRLTAEDLQEMGMNPLWREALLSASRSLRSSLVQGRIWGFDEIPPLNESPTKGLRRSLPSTVFEHEPPKEETPKESAGWISRGMGLQTLARSRNGRVKNMVATFERAASSSSEPSSPEDDDASSGASYLRDRDDLKDVSLEFSPPDLSHHQPMPWPITQDEDAGYASSDFTQSGSEMSEGDLTSDRYTDTTGDTSIQTVTEDDDILRPEDLVMNLKDTSSRPLQISTDPVSTESPGLLQTPPPMYASPAHDDPFFREDDSAEKTDTTKATAPTLVKSLPARVKRDSMSTEGTMEELIANFTMNSLDNRHTIPAAWGAKAWEELEEMGPGATSRRIQDTSRHPSEEAAAQHPPLLDLFNPLAQEVETQEPIPEAPRSTTEAQTEPSFPYNLSEADVLALIERERYAQAMLVEFGRRLEVLERRLEQLELQDPEIERALEDARKAKETEESTPSQSTSTAVVPTDTAPKVQEETAVEETKVAESSTSTARAVKPTFDDSNITPTTLPSFVLLVGLGLATVVIRVMLRARQRRAL